MDVAKELSSYILPVEEEIFKYVGKELEPKELYKPLYDLFKRGGKRIRPAICMVACEAVGGKLEDALKIAGAIEMVHNFTLIHDDIADKSELRRGKPCLHHIYGYALAINAGDGLFSRAYEVVSDSLKELKSERFGCVFAVLSKAITEVCEGQAMDISWAKQNRWDITREDYLGMLRRKTGALISAACECGAIIGGGSDEQVKALKDFGMHIGVAFQIHDDVLNISGDVEKYGKEIGGDINEGKRTLMVIETLQECSADEKKRLIEILDEEGNSQKEIREALDIIHKYGSIERASKLALQRAEEAKNGLDVLRETRYKEILLGLADYFVNREK